MSSPMRSELKAGEALGLTPSLDRDLAERQIPETFQQELRALRRLAASPLAMKEALGLLHTYALNFAHGIRFGSTQREVLAKIDNAMAALALDAPAKEAAAPGGDDEPDAWQRRTKWKYGPRAGEWTDWRNLPIGYDRSEFSEIEYEDRPLYAAPPLQAPADSDAVRWRTLAVELAKLHEPYVPMFSSDAARRRTASGRVLDEIYELERAALAPAAKAPAVSEADVGRLERELADCQGALDTIAAHRKDSRTQWGNERFYQGKVSALKFALSLIQSCGTDAPAADREAVARVQQAIQNHPHFQGNSATAFGLANTAILALHTSTSAAEGK